MLIGRLCLPGTRLEGDWALIGDRALCTGEPLILVGRPICTFNNANVSCMLCTPACDVALSIRISYKLIVKNSL